LSTERAAAVEVIGLHKVFAGVSALSDVSMRVLKNEFFSLLGPSGCGKTTLLRIIGGFEYPSQGDVRIHDQSVVDLPPYLRKTNMVFQHLALFPHLSVAQNIMFPLEMKRVPRDVARRKIAEALDMVRLAGLQDRMIHELSGGQRQRVAIARALVGDPEVVLFDEPLGALDLKLRLQMQDELRRLQKMVGSTFIFVTHDQAEAIAMSDRIAVMQGGRIMQIGTPYEIYETPSCRFVADFIGHSNLVEASVRGAAAPGRCAVTLDGVTLAGKCGGDVGDGQVVTVSMRYEKFKVSMTQNPAATNSFQAEVVERKYLGTSIRLRLRLSERLTLQADLPLDADSDGFQQGKRVHVAIEPDSVVVLTK
jgi:spermidine/putrescine transport system ATP-binding protein